MKHQLQFAQVALTVFVTLSLCLPPTAYTQDSTLDKPLKLEQIEQLLTIGWDDAVLARETLKRGISFRADDKAFERLAKKKLGPQTRATLLQLETRAAFQDIQNAKDATARLNSAQQFLRLHPDAQNAKEARLIIRDTELELFDSAYRAYLAAPELPKLNALFTRSDELRQRETEPLVALHLTTRLAIATGRGLFHNSYTDLERSRQLTNEAYKQLNATAAPANVSVEAFQKLRDENLGALCQLLAYFHLRQTPADMASALRLLEQATATNAPTTKDPLTYWLRAWANRETHQRLRMEISALTPDARASATGQTTCQQYSALTAHLIEDYTKVVELSGSSNDARTLRDESVAAVKALSLQPNPCLAPAAPPAQRARRVQTNDARRTVFIRSKTVYLKPAQLESAVLANADFQALGWRVVRNEKEADVIADVTLPFLTWQWTLELTHQPTSTLLGTAQVRETIARNAIPRLAAQLIATLKQAKF